MRLYEVLPAMYAGKPVTRQTVIKQVYFRYSELWNKFYTMFEGKAIREGNTIALDMESLYADDWLIGEYKHDSEEAVFEGYKDY
jgi:hypothetical protein